MKIRSLPHFLNHLTVIRVLEIEKLYCDAQILRRQLAITLMVGSKQPAISFPLIKERERPCPPTAQEREMFLPKPVGPKISVLP